MYFKTGSPKILGSSAPMPHLTGYTFPIKELFMAKNEQTSKKAATAASKVLRDPRASKAAKTAAGSALTQRPNKGK